jgi:hypothetical protein
MRFPLPAFLSLFIVLHSSSFAATPPAPPANARTIRTLPDFPLAHLKTSISPKLYKSLLISPLTAWVVAQAPASGSEPKLLRSDAGGVFDKLALEMAKGWGSVGYNTTESRTQRPSLKVHLLIYKIVDGVMAVNFAHNDQAFYAGAQHSDIWVGVFKNGKWTRIGGTKIIRNFPEPYR